MAERFQVWRLAVNRIASTLLEFELEWLCVLTKNKEFSLAKVNLAYALNYIQLQNSLSLTRASKACENFGEEEFLAGERSSSRLLSIRPSSL